ncbi:NF038396 family protein [Paenarthrobacter nitroguajacolicus]|uniref:NF038396 family protein n=1 Tax=Paenarthrobacter nitroguajacolicus TaxID=211146 RepID=UPI00248B934D|nr:NF038396 family protein [Paenarthrobacter nitroguajacolicus]
MLKKPETLFVLGYMLLPLFALLSAIVGLTMILGGNKIVGIIVLVVVTQVFTFGAFFALRARKAALLQEPQGPDAGN